jgi:hypothetical protein
MCSGTTGQVVSCVGFLKEILAWNEKHGTLLEQSHHTVPILVVGSRLTGQEARTNPIDRGTCANVMQSSSLEMAVTSPTGGVEDE